MSNHADKRRYSRRHISQPVQIKLNSYNDFTNQYATDISAGGLFLVTPTPYEIGDTVDIEFYLESHPHHFFKVRGEVTRINQNPRGMGIRFTQIEASSQIMLNELLMRMSA